jgi:dipeptidyl aminopeptidase/acylaminoacyl peptidase
MISRVHGLTRIAVVAGVVGILVLPVERGSAVVPGENGKIAFASTRTGNREIYVVSPDTTGLARLTNDPAVDTDPAWAGDGKRIAFTSTREGNDDIYLMNADGTGQTQLTSTSGSDSNATWSPLGRNIAFTSTRDGDGDIYAMNEDGTGQAPLTSNSVADANPSWSPDGASIAFRSERDGNSEIYVMKVDGTDVVRLTFNSALDVSPAWSPDGKSIAWASNRDGNYEIYVMNSDGSGERRLTRNLDVDLDPAWSPDGRSITYTSNRDGNYEIYVMNADGSSQTRLTTDAAEDTTPDWQWQQTVPVPPPPIEDASFRVRWKESVLSGSLRVTGRVPGLSKIQLALRRGKHVYVAVGLTLTKGAFVKNLALPRDLTPGPFVLDVTATGSPTDLSAQTMRVLLEAPPEGVVSDAWGSSTVGGPPLQTVPRTNGIVWAQFQFAALPRARKMLTTTWLIGGQRPRGVRPKPKPRQPMVIAWLRPPEGEQLPRGKYTCVLSWGTTVVKRVTFRVA